MDARTLFAAAHARARFARKLLRGWRAFFCLVVLVSGATRRAAAVLDEDVEVPDEDEEHSSTSEARFLPGAQFIFVPGA